MGTEKWKQVAPYVVIACLAFAYIGSLKREPPAEITIKPAPQEAPAKKSVTVHVVGAVKSAGVYTLSSEMRVTDAIAKAGGSLADADLEDINLAATLIDGSQVYVPHKDKTQNKQDVADSYKGGSASANPYRNKDTNHSATAGPKHPSGPVSLNTSSAEQLQQVPGIGPSTAESIIEYRHLHGGFATVDEVMNVKGIGPKKMEKMRKWLRL